MSGGVDSSAAAIITLRDGGNVSGAAMTLVNSGADDADAENVCRLLGIAFYVFDYSKEFKLRVIDKFIESYMSGDTPNPCIDCNRDIKFGVFLKRALNMGFDYIATGHYARVKLDTASGRYHLMKAKDLSKDQSYALYSLNQEQLAHTLLPLGEYTKAEARELAAELGLNNAQRPDSQDICFVRNESYRDFISARAGNAATAGDFTDVGGNILGRHKGIESYTVGQRKGIGISSDAPLYVCRKDAKSNTVILGSEQELYSKTLTVRDMNLIVTAKLNAPVTATVRIRYNGAEAPAILHQVSDSEAVVEFYSPQRAVSPGQAAVFYDGETVIGGGTIY